MAAIVVPADDVLDESGASRTELHLPTLHNDVGRVVIDVLHHILLAQIFVVNDYVAKQSSEYSQQLFAAINDELFLVGLDVAY